MNLRYAYDRLNRITNVLAGGSLGASYGFDLNGNVQCIRYGNGLTNLYQYDVLNRLTNSVWKSNQLTVASFYYQLGGTGNRTNLTETLFTSVTNRSYAWAYDSLYRLTNETISALGNLGYKYDQVGNRTNRLTTGTVASPLPSVTNLFGENDWLTTDAYDCNGNTLWTTNGGAATGPYYYDLENHLTNFDNSVFLAYNGDGNRVRKTVNGTNFYYLIAERNPSGYAQVLEEWAASGGTTNLTRVYNYGLALVSQQEGTTVYYFIPDGHGSTRLLTDGTGVVVNALTYDAYGSLLGSDDAPATTYLYCGEQFDPDLGLYYLRARYFNPQTGRFWTADDGEQGDQEDPKSMHLYTYCESDPVNHVDPSGHDIGEMLTVMDIGFSFFAQISPATAAAPAAARRVLGVGRVSSRAFWEIYPDYNAFNADMVWDLVGGSIGKEYATRRASNQMSCATRVSFAMNNVGGNEIPDLGTTSSPRSYRNRSSVSYHRRSDDNKYYIVGAGDMKDYLLQKWGKEDAKVWDVPKLKQFVGGLSAGQIAVFATPGLHGLGHSGVLKQGYQDPHVERELVPIWVWALSTP